MNLDDPHGRRLQIQTRRQFLRAGKFSLGAVALAQLMGDRAGAAKPQAKPAAAAATTGAHVVHAPPKGGQAKNVIYLHMSGGPPQQELFDYKPELVKRNLQPCPDSLLKNARFAFIKGHPNMLGTPYKFKQQGKSGAWVSELLPQIGAKMDDIALINSMVTDQFNHAPAELFLFTGSANAGGASMGSWITYGLGSENSDLPGFVVLVSGGTDPTGGKSLWGSGFLPSVHQGVQCRSVGEPILYVNDPAGMSRDVRRRSLDTLNKLNELESREFGDPETRTRIEQYELAFRMQTAVPDVMNIANESKATHEAYGTKPGEGSFANNCLLARRLVERGVRFVQLFDWGWDCHGTGPGDDIVVHLPKKAAQIDKPISALLTDLKQRGMLDETLVVWGGEFGRTSMNEARGGSKSLGRDHHPHCYSMWLAGGGVKGGTTLGATDEFGYAITRDPVGVRDLQATVLHLLGLDPFQQKYPYQGLDQRLIGPDDAAARIRPELIA
ncbi:MAG: DUF1501 domain-containing protein [Planctomycetia bacterium]|nr:DUF1501 domain-containing protein [Planctomycetia bacterium]